MIQYNIEIWSRDWSLKDHLQVADVKIKVDYLDYEKNKIELFHEPNAELEDYIRIYDGKRSYCGIIKTIEPKSNKTNITWTTFDLLLDIDVLVNSVGGKTLENCIGDYIRETYINNADIIQNMEGIEVQVLSATTEYVIETDKIICNLYDDIVQPSFCGYGVRVLWEMDVSKKKIIAKISTCINDVKVIETELPNVTDTSITIKKTSATVNKIIVHNEENMSEKAEYYLTNAGTVTTENTDRMVPVSYQIKTVKYKGEETFTEVALKKATDIFSKIKYTNLIEIECYLDDTLINPLEMEIGQVVNIYKNSLIYNSMFTGIEIKDNVTLIFGTIRLELTKQLKGRG